MCSRVRVALLFIFFFFNDTATTEIYTLSLHDALPISSQELASLDVVGRLLDGLLELTMRLHQVALRQLRSTEHDPGGHQARYPRHEALEIGDSLRITAASELDPRTEELSDRYVRKQYGESAMAFRGIRELALEQARLRNVCEHARPLGKRRQPGHALAGDEQRLLGGGVPALAREKL